MFEDFFSSSRGPGLVGLLLAFVVLAGFTFFGMAVLDGRFNGDDANSLAVRVEEQAAEIAHLERRALDLEAELERAGAVKEMQSEVERLNGRLAKANQTTEEEAAKVAALTSTVEEIRASHHTYLQNYRESVRKKAEGTKIDKLTTKSGKEYTNAEIRRVDALGLTLRDETGPKGVAWDDLPDEMQDYYQFGADERPKAEQEEKAADEAAKKRREKVEQQRKNEQQANLKAADAKERIARERRIANLKQGIRSAQGKIEEKLQEAARYRRLHDYAVARGNISGHLVEAQKAEQAAKALEDKIEAAEKQIAELRKSLR